jgi:hypothetical protein
MESQARIAVLVRAQAGAGRSGGRGMERGVGGAFADKENQGDDLEHREDSTPRPRTGIARNDVSTTQRL